MVYFLFMISLRSLRIVSMVVFVTIVGSSFALHAFADDAADGTPAGLKQEVDDLNVQISVKEKRVQEMEQTIKTYNEKIKTNEQQVTSLQNEVVLLENRIQEKLLAVERTKQQIDITNLEIQSLIGQLTLAQAGIVRREAGLGDLVRQLAEADRVTSVDVLIAQPTLSAFFVRLDQLNRVEEELVNATQSLKRSKRQLETQQHEMETRRVALLDQQHTLEQEEQDLTGVKSARVSLIAETQNKEGEFQRILYELRQQQQSEASDAADLQSRLKDKLDAVDRALARGDVLLNLPVPVLRGISAGFHDPSYPFRKLFEHPGIDIPTQVGTPVHAAAGGYVAWNRKGKQYGNYVMIVHPGGIATVYAHLSRFAAKPDSYVERGDVIGFSGGRPGDEGAGLSTGAHLHFEVRQNGIPVNPMQYLPSVE